VPPAEFQRWRALALRAYNQVAAASAGKVVLSLGWFALGTRLGVPTPWFQLVGFAVFLAWALLMVKSGLMRACCACSWALIRAAGRR
jgi:hypothetical protein